MKNYIFGYARVSTESQNLNRQLDALGKYGVEMIYNEKMTGTKKTAQSCRSCSNGSRGATPSW